MAKIIPVDYTLKSAPSSPRGTHETGILRFPHTLLLCLLVLTTIRLTTGMIPESFLCPITWR